MIKPKYLINLMVGNILKTRNPLGVRDSSINTWWHGITKRDGEWMVFTGLLYQLTPYLNKIASYLERFDESRLQSLFPVLNKLPSSLLNFLIFRAPKKEKEETEKILKSIYLLLSKNIDAFYKPESDIYSGIMLYDMGCYDEFEAHVNYVTSKLKSAGVRKLVTIDPHTAYALSVLYPKYGNFDFEVRHYLEILSEEQSYIPKLSFSLGNTLHSIHDSCYLSRYLDLSECPRIILERIGIEYEEVKNSKKNTFCCGGPLETFFPKISNEIARRRVGEFEGKKIITLCPICLATLRRAGGDVRDIASFYDVV